MNKKGWHITLWNVKLLQASPHPPVQQENEEDIWAHFTSLGAFKCVHPVSGVEPSADVIVAAGKQGALY